jgi:hypothetical protein
MTIVAGLNHQFCTDLFQDPLSSCDIQGPSCHARRICSQRTRMAFLGPWKKYPLDLDLGFGEIKMIAIFWNLRSRCKNFVFLLSSLLI